MLKRASAITTTALATAVAGATGVASIQYFGVSKEIDSVQISPALVVLDPHMPYFFDAGVYGSELGLIPAPVVTGPIHNPALGEDGSTTLGYNAEEDAWEYGAPTYDGWSTQTLAEMDAMFGNGTYTFQIFDLSYPVDLVGDAYPSQTPVLTLSGGVWGGQRYLLAPGADLTITTSDSPEYGTHAEDVIHLNLHGPAGAVEEEILQFASSTPTPSISHTYPGALLADEGVYEADAGFGSVVSFIDVSEDLPEAVEFASYERSTTVRILVTEHGCNGADLAEPFGVLDLADVVAFVTAFQAGDQRADLMMPFWTFDLADLVEFVTEFTDGCP